MGFSINTNINSLMAQAGLKLNQRLASESLEKLMSGKRINSAADDASGMQIANSLRSQASSLGQAINNGNDALGIAQIADRAMEEQVKILDKIKEKSVQAAQDSQTPETRKAIQQDIAKLMEELDNIANSTSFNGQKLLSGGFSNKEFQIGAYSNETVKMSIGSTSSNMIGLTRFETGHNVTIGDVSDGTDLLDGYVNLTFKNADGLNDISLAPIKIVATGGTAGAPTVEIKAGMGLGKLAEEINKISDKTGVKANAVVQSTFEQSIKAGNTTDAFSINGVKIGKIEVKDNDGNGALRDAINSVSDRTGVTASVDSSGRLVLDNKDGRGIQITDDPNHTNGMATIIGLDADNSLNLGRLTFSKQGGRDIQIDVKDGNGKNASALLGFDKDVSEKTLSLRELSTTIDDDTADALGFNAMTWQKGKTKNLVGVQSFAGAQAMMDISEAARKNLDSTRAEIGSVQNQIKSTINNLQTTQVNIRASESTIRDVDFAAESQNFQKYMLLNQTGNFAMAQSKMLQQSILSLLQ